MSRNAKICIKKLCHLFLFAYDREILHFPYLDRVWSAFTFSLKKDTLNFLLLLIENIYGFVFTPALATFITLPSIKSQGHDYTKRDMIMALKLIYQ